MRLCLLLAACLTKTVCAVQAPPVQLVPAVSEVKWGPALPVKGSTVILLSPQASPPEKHAAELLQKCVQRRFGQKWAIVSSTDASKDAGLRVIRRNELGEGLVSWSIGQKPGIRI